MFISLDPENMCKNRLKAAGYSVVQDLFIPPNAKELRSQRTGLNVFYLIQIYGNFDKYKCRQVGEWFEIIIQILK